MFLKFFTSEKVLKQSLLSKYAKMPKKFKKRHLFLKVTLDPNYSIDLLSTVEYDAYDKFLDTVIKSIKEENKGSVNFALPGETSVVIKIKFVNNYIDNIIKQSKK